MNNESFMVSSPSPFLSRHFRRNLENLASILVGADKNPDLRWV